MVSVIEIRDFLGCAICASADEIVDGVRVISSRGNNDIIRDVERLRKILKRA